MSLIWLGKFIHFYDFFFFQAEDGIRDVAVTGVQTCALPISPPTLQDGAFLAFCDTGARRHREEGRPGEPAHRRVLEVHPRPGPAAGFSLLPVPRDPRA